MVQRGRGQQTNEHTENFAILQDFVPFRPLPKKHVPWAPRIDGPRWTPAPPGTLPLKGRRKIEKKRKIGKKSEKGTGLRTEGVGGKKEGEMMGQIGGKGLLKGHVPWTPQHGDLALGREYEKGLGPSQPGLRAS